MNKKGIDVSRWQGTIDFEKVASSGIDFVMIKAGGSDAGFYTDRNFLYNYDNAKSVGLPVGAYYFAGSNSYGTEAGMNSAEHFLSIINGLSFEYPVVLDMETTDPTRKEEATDFCIAFCEFLENAGYYVMIYGSDISTFKDRLQIGRLTAYDKWVAKYSKNPPYYVRQYNMWQYSSRGTVKGIEGNVDLNISYIDFEKLIMERGFNNC